MRKEYKETLSVRVISCAFVVLALWVFKPFGLETWHWQAYIHLLMIFLLGIIICNLTDVILKYIFRMPISTEQDVDYIIRRNLRFQLINTPLIALMICLYRHFLLSDHVEGNHLSWSNFLETLAIIAFCSFAIGLYWRFKYRSRYLAAELEETQQLNEQLKKISSAAAPPPTEKKGSTPEKDSHKPEQGEISEVSAITLTGTTADTITLEIADLLYIEAVGNYVKIYHLRDGKVCNDMLRATSKQMEEELRAYPTIVRCHRAFLVNLRQVEKAISNAGSMQLLIRHHHDSIPVSRSNMAQIKKAIHQLL